MIVASQAFHGLAYVFFIIAGQMYAGAVAPEGTGGSMQALVFTAQKYRRSLARFYAHLVVSHPRPTVA